MTKLLEIEARLKAATPGPWDCHRFDDISGDIDFQVQAGCGPVIAWCDNGDNQNNGADSNLIAHAPTDIAELIQAVREAAELIRDKTNCPCEYCLLHNKRARSWRKKWGSQ